MTIDLIVGINQMQMYDTLKPPRLEFTRVATTPDDAIALVDRGVKDGLQCTEIRRTESNRFVVYFSKSLI